jgi:hypothetical protein
MLSYNSLVKKILLTLVGVVGLTGVSWGQSGFIPSSLVVNGYDFSLLADSNGYRETWSGYFDEETQTQITDPNNISSVYEIGNGIGNNDPIGYSTRSTIQKTADGNYEVSLEVSKTDTFYYGGKVVAKFIGSSLDDLTLDPESLKLYEFDPNTQWWSETPTPIITDNMPTTTAIGDLIPAQHLSVISGHFPPLIGGGSGGAFLEKAQGLNSGLVFQDGRWIPSP